MNAVLNERVVVIEAGGGYGKTTLAAEIVEGWNSIPIEIPLHEGAAGTVAFTSRLRFGIEDAGFPAAAATIHAMGADQYAPVEAAIAALAGERCTFVVDDAHHADEDAAALIAWIAESLRANQHLIVLARRVPSGAERLQRAECCCLQADELALRVDETLTICREGFGLALERDAAAALHAATGGWTAATVLSAARARRTGEALTDIAHEADAERGQAAVATILGEALSTLDDDDLRQLAQIARIVPTDAEMVDRITCDGFFERVLTLGIPLAPTGDGRWDLPGPVSDFLVGRAPADIAMLTRAAAYRADRGETGAAVELLLSVGARDEAAALLGDAAASTLEQVDVLTYEAYVSELGREASDRHPSVLLQLARMYEAAAMWEKSTAMLDRLEQLTLTPAHTQALEVERITERMRSSEYELVRERATEVLAGVGDIDLVTEARALSALARAVYLQADDAGARDESAIRDASKLFAQAADRYRRAGLLGAAVGMVPYQAMWTQFAVGDARAALQTLDDGLALVVDRPRRWGFLQSFRAEVLTELGSYGEATDAARQVVDTGERLDDHELQAFGHWNHAAIASHLGDPRAVIEHLRLVEQHPGEWLDTLSGDLFGDAADLLDRVNEVTLALQYLERALRDPKDGGPAIAMAQAALTARHGDPHQAEALLSGVFGHGVDPRERWRVTLLRAYAGFRRGEHGAGPLAARAFEEAARIGLEQLPLTKEREVTEALLGLAVETGQPAAIALDQAALPATLSVLGAFSLTRGGRQVPLSAGRGSQLLKLLACAGGYLPADGIIEALWPTADPETGRNRLRTTLSRLRSEAGDVVVREGATLSLADDMRVDLREFEREARRALALGMDEPELAMAVAASAIARYRGDVLPGDSYEPWLERPREHARRLALELLDLCSDVATDRGDLDELRRYIELAIELAPYDEHRYLRAASALLEQGRRGAARAVLARARSALAELGVPPPLDLVRIERRAVS